MKSPKVFRQRSGPASRPAAMGQKQRALLTHGGTPRPPSKGPGTETTVGDEGAAKGHSERPLGGKKCTDGSREKPQSAKIPADLPSALTATPRIVVVLGAKAKNLQGLSIKGVPQKLQKGSKIEVAGVEQSSDVNYGSTQRLMKIIKAGLESDKEKRHLVEAQKEKDNHEPEDDSGKEGHKIEKATEKKRDVESQGDQLQALSKVPEADFAEDREEDSDVVEERLETAPKPTPFQPDTDKEKEYDLPDPDCKKGAVNCEPVTIARLKATHNPPAKQVCPIPETTDEGSMLLTLVKYLDMEAAMAKFRDIDAKLKALSTDIKRGIVDAGRTIMARWSASNETQQDEEIIRRPANAFGCALGNISKVSETIIEEDPDNIVDRKQPTDCQAAASVMLSLLPERLPCSSHGDAPQRVNDETCHEPEYTEDLELVDATLLQELGLSINSSDSDQARSGANTPRQGSTPRGNGTLNASIGVVQLNDTTPGRTVTHAEIFYPIDNQLAVAQEPLGTTD